MKKYVWGLAAIAIMVIGFAVPSQAASFKVGDTDWTLGGSARLDVGWRIDYFYVSSDVAKRVKAACILPAVMGSDHCPIGIELLE